MTDRVEFVCKNCSAVFVRYASQLKNVRQNAGTYCSLACRNVAARVARSLNMRATFAERFWRKAARAPNGCLEWQGSISSSGYGTVKQEGLARSTHVVAWTLTYGEPSDWVLHRCDNRKCVDPNHLFIGSRQDNVDDMMRKGRLNSRIGSANHRAQLTEAQVQEIRERFAVGGVRQVDLATEYGVTQTTISVIVRGASWKHLS